MARPNKELERYNEKLRQRLRQANANARHETVRKANAERGATSPLGGQAKPMVRR
jgi:hypothetical protein